MTMPATSALPAVVFDLDGLMFNTEDLYDEVGSAILGRRGFRYSAELRQKMMGRPGRDALQIMIDEHRLDATVDQLQQETDEIFSGLLDTRLALMPGLAELLTALETAGRAKAIATSSRRQYAERVLSQFDLAPRFAFTLTSEDVERGKPHPEVYLTAAARLGVDPRQMLVLEDSQNGCRAAIAAGAVTVAVPSEHSRHHEFDGTHFIAESLADRRIYDLLELP